MACARCASAAAARARAWSSRGDPEYLALQYTQTAFVGLALADAPRRMLVVGVGGGTLPMFLRRHYPDATIDAVDIDPQVIDVARKFLGFREDATLRAHVADGRAFIEAVREPYDVIFLDAFSSSELPAHLTTREFLQAVRRALTPSGVVVGNVWDRYANRLYDSMLRTYQDVFDELYILSVQSAGNKILLALPRPLTLSEADLEARARAVSKRRASVSTWVTLPATVFCMRGSQSSTGRCCSTQNLSMRVIRQ